MTLRKIGLPLGVAAATLAFGTFGTSVANADRYYSSRTYSESHHYTSTRTVRYSQSSCRPVRPVRHVCYNTYRPCYAPPPIHHYRQQPQLSLSFSFHHHRSPSHHRSVSYHRGPSHHRQHDRCRPQHRPYRVYYPHSRR
ncbi:MAG: hypothetical protein JXQ75_01755 [Phycisphaerae bacterium]|nr:hypothetical protein [Phycisphaerae bacterium]